MEFKYLANLPAELDKTWTAEAYHALLAQLDGLSESSPAAEWLELVAHWNEVKAVLSGERARTSWGEAVDVRDELAAARAKIFRSEIQSLATEKNALLRRAMLDGPALEQIKERYGAFLIDQWECAEIAANPVNIELDVKDKQLSTDYHALRGKAQIEFHGKARTLTMLEKMLENSDEEIRKGAFEAMMAWYQENRAELDRIYLELVQLRHQAGLDLEFETFTPLGYKKMRRLDYGPAEAAQFRAQVLKHVAPLVRQLRAQQAQAATGGEEIKPWNRKFLPGLSLPENVAPVDGQLAGVLEIYGRLHPKLAEHFQRMIDQNLIDLENRPGKRGGAFCTSMPDRDEVRIFCNSTGAASDVRTLLHESGHAFQGWESQWIKAVELQHPTLEAAEIHSMGMEFLALPHIEVFFNPEKERKFKRGQIIEFMQFLCYACVVDGFQHKVYANPSMTAEELADTWCELWDQFMVGEDWSGHREELGTYWQHKQHITTRPFYYIDYALALLCALQLWRLSTQDPAEALERYLNLCRLGGTRSFAALVQSAGLEDPFAESTLVNVLTTVKAALGME